MHEVPLLLPRSAFTPRETARAGDLWRVFQDVAVGGSIQAGWPPERYREAGVSFIVRSMVVVHARETMYGERLMGTTWPSRFRRGMFFQRECRVQAGGEPIASATQQWVHVASDLSLVKASEELSSCFGVEDHGPPVELPSREAIEPRGGPRLSFECWHTWMDPLAHVNHPAYVDWCDEALARWMVAAGMDPVQVRPVAESAHYRLGVVAGERVDVTTDLIGRTEAGDAVFAHEVEVAGERRAKLVTIRRLATEHGDSALLALTPSSA